MGVVWSCVRGFSEGKSEASKRATNFGLAKTSNFFYTVLANGYYFVNTLIQFHIHWLSKIKILLSRYIYLPFQVPKFHS